MKHIFPVTHFFLLFVAAILYPAIKKAPNNELVFAEWQLITASIQLATAAFLSYSTRQSKQMQKLLGCYWVAAGGALYLLGAWDNADDPRHIIFLYAIPWFIATYFTIIVFLSSYSKDKNYNYEK